MIKRVKKYIKKFGEAKKRFLEYFGIRESFVLFFLVFFLFIYLLFTAPGVIGTTFIMFLQLSPLWLPFVLWRLTKESWVHYIQGEFFASQKYILLEIKVPRDVSKSPKAMELVFSGLHIGAGESNFIARWWYGKTRPWFSFELASIEGKIHFFIWTRAFFKPSIETQFYAAYPEIEIVEVEDYTKGFRYIKEAMGLWGCDFILSGEDVMPIKTYVDYELDKDPKEELKITPIAHLFEYLSSFGPGEQLWLQILVRTNKEKRFKEDSWAKEDRWAAEGRAKVEEIRKKTASKFTDASGKEMDGFPNPTPSQMEQIRAIERSISKQPFDVGIRAIYLAQKKKFRPIGIIGLLGIFKQFGSANLNGFRPAHWNALFDFPWQDFRGMREGWIRGRVLEMFRKRAWFYPPFSWKQLILHPPIHKHHFVLTTEELATIYHIPSRVVQAPGLVRIQAAKAEAPPNLPV